MLAAQTPPRLSMNTSEVKAFFEQTDVYLTYNYNLRIRAETVGYFIRDKYFDKVLDMPCGTGDISAPFLDQFGHLTMMDFSENMIATARKRVSAENQFKTTFITSDFYHHDFQGESFDLVMNIGILAHIENPWKFLDQSLKLVKPGGYVIVQNTDSDHWFAQMIHFYLGMRRLVGKDKYALNKVKEKLLVEKIERAGFKCIESFRYNQSFLGLSRFFSNDLKYKLTRKLFGFAGEHKRQSSGSDVTFLFRKME